MSKRKILAMPAVCFWAIVGVCLLGIGIGSFRDLDIARAIANKTDLGTYFATFSPFLAYALLPAGGACLFAGIRKKGDSFKAVAWLLAIFGWFMAVYFSNNYFGKNVRPLMGYTAGESSALLSGAGWLVWAVLYAWVPFVTVRLLDDSDPDRLILVGAALILSSIMADVMMQWLKSVASRPRPKYLFQPEVSESEFRNWWEMIPYYNGGKDDMFASWPSGHMSIVGVVFALPLLTDCMKNRSDRRNTIAFCLACIFVLVCGYNRMHMTNHFLSDVCFGTLNTYLMTAGICTAFTKALPKDRTI